MINLAGDNNADEHIKRELTRSRIDLVQGELQPGEVQASITGRLGDFRFRRAWRYWVVEGPVPDGSWYDMGINEAGHPVVWTNGKVGLTAADADRAIGMLKGRGM